MFSYSTATNLTFDAAHTEFEKGIAKHQVAICPYCTGQIRSFDEFCDHVHDDKPGTCKGNTDTHAPMDVDPPVDTGPLLEKVRIY